jgi:hypothetical protein
LAVVRQEIDMGIKRAALIVAAVVAVAGLVLLRTRVAPAEESFFRSEIWLPHRGLGEGYDLALPFEGPIAGEKVSLEEARRRVPFPIPLPGYLPGDGALKEVYASSDDTATEFREAALVYANKIYIIMYYDEATLGWAWPFAEFPDIFKPVEVAGHPGLGAEPRLARTCVRYAPSEEQECRDGPGLAPGVVEWQADGLVISVSSYDYSLAELLRVAESMHVP